MKNLFSKTIVLLFLGLSAISCSDDNDQPQVSANNTKSKISYDIGGKTYNCDIIGYSKTGSEASLDLRTEVSGGFNNDSDNSISFSCYSGVGSSFTNLGITKEGKSYWNIDELASNVVINNDEKVQGTFSGKLFRYNDADVKEFLEVQNGAFTVYFDE